MSRKPGECGGQKLEGGGRIGNEGVVPGRREWPLVRNMPKGLTQGQRSDSTQVTRDPAVGGGTAERGG